MAGEPFFPERVYRYMAVHMRVVVEPSFIVDISRDLPESSRPSRPTSRSSPATPPTPASSTSSRARRRCGERWAASRPASRSSRSSRSPFAQSPTSSRRQRGPREAGASGRTRRSALAPSLRRVGGARTRQPRGSTGLDVLGGRRSGDRTPRRRPAERPSETQRPSRRNWAFKSRCRARPRTSSSPPATSPSSITQACGSRTSYSSDSPRRTPPAPWISWSTPMASRCLESARRA